MVNIALKRPLSTLAVTAGLLVAAGPASASQAGPLAASGHAEATNAPPSFELVLDGVDVGWSSPLPPRGATYIDDALGSGFYGKQRAR
jgi:hypothetical protein